MGRFFQFPTEGRHAEDFSDARKNPTTSAGFEPANLGTRGQQSRQRSALVLGVMEVSNETLQLDGWGLVHGLDTDMSPIKCFCIVFGSTVRNVISMRKFGGIPEKLGAFGMSHDAPSGSYYK